MLKLFTFLLCLSCLSSFACPNEVLIIRHGEKPPSGPQLSTQGIERANALTRLFSTPNSNFSKPNYIAVTNNKSERAVGTCSPTAKILGLPLNNAAYVGGPSSKSKAITQLLHQEGTILICTNHRHLAPLAKALTRNQLDIGRWKGDVFNRILLLHFKEAHGVCQYTGYQDLPQAVLPTDKVESKCCTKA